ncbi:MAG: hypothetical protein HY327_13840 [Chloroflexi bacterium]|nr:hypothetical protein [Chloroflexota bacterium]
MLSANLEKNRSVPMSILKIRVRFDADGLPTPLADGKTIARASALGLDARAYLENNGA